MWCVCVCVCVQVTGAYPGEKFALGIRALDEIGRPTSDIIRLSDLSNKVCTII